MKLSPACDGCYAWAQQDVRYSRVQFGGPGVGVGSRSLTSDSNWREPHRWNRKAAEAGTHPFVFGGSLMDPFDKHVPPAWRRRYFDEVIRPTPHLVWLLLTKRPQLIIDLAEDAGGLPPNVALGTTTEDRERWNQNVPELVNAKAVTGALFAFVSAEPLLGAIYPRKAPVSASMKKHFAWQKRGHEWFDPIHPDQDPRFKLDWIITGGETDQGGHKARATLASWNRAFRDACAETQTPYHHKQNGEWIDADNWLDTLRIAPSPILLKGAEWKPRRPLNYEDAALLAKITNRRQFEHQSDGTTPINVGKVAAGRLLDGRIHDERPQIAA